VIVLAPFAFTGMLNGMGRDRGAASALEQVLLPATTTDERRTRVLALYNVVLDSGHAVGALAGATPTVLIRVQTCCCMRHSGRSNRGKNLALRSTSKENS
jgi:hypothetical protein